MSVVRLENLDQARALVDCFYATYGLTFHRRYVYDPHRLLELNREGHVTSFIACDRGRVVGHLGVFAPFFEVRRDGRPIVDPGTREVGLSVVRPDARCRGVQADLGRAAFRWSLGAGVRGAFMKCVTNHTFSQRTAFANGGTPTALFLGGVARWVVYDGDQERQEQPISTVVYYVPFQRGPSRPICLSGGREWLGAHVRATRVHRHAAAATAPSGAPSDLEVTWQGERRIATVHVLSAGPDLAARLEETCTWLAAGHIEHVTAFVPAGDPGVSDDELRAAGLFLGGWIPELYAAAGDVLVYQWLSRDDMEPEAIHTWGRLATSMKEEVLGGWRATQRRLAAAA